MMSASFSTVLATLLLGGLAAPALAEPTPAPAPAAAAEPAPPAPDSDHAADLAKAADAAADVANLPPSAAAAPAAAEPPKSSDDIDLASLGLDPASSAAAFDDKLNIYGFADFNWLAYHWDRDLPGIRRDTRGFFVGNLNLYLAKNLTRRWRTLAEVRFSFLPNDSTNADGSTTAAFATDVTDSSRVTQWGSVLIQRAYVEYDLTDHLTLRAGHWLTPYGIWNIDHGSPAIITTARPYIIGEQLIPEHQTGLQLLGSQAFDAYKLNYTVTASNGRGSAESQEDLDNDIAVGARAELETPYGLRLGGSFYEGKATSFATSVGATPPSFREVAYAADLLYDHNGLHLQSELIVRERKYDDGARALGARGFAADGRDYGFYALAGYRFSSAWNVMPYGYYERYRPIDGAYFRGVDDASVGLNFRPTATIVLKVQGGWATFEDGPYLLAGSTLYSATTQAAWLF